MIITYALLALSICAVWFPSIQFITGSSLPPWFLLFLCATVSGLATEYLRPSALISLGIFLLPAYLTVRKQASRPQRIGFGMLTALIALALAMHRLPGFNNPVLFAGVKLSLDAAPFTLYANFDKGVVGLVLLALFCRRTSSFSEWSNALRKSLPIMAATFIGVLTVAISIGYVKPEFKLSTDTLTFLSVNLFFTVVAEEAFFRGFLQDRLANALASINIGNAIAIVISSLLFGLAHFAGGLAYVGLATLAGFGYALAYAYTQRIESSIAAHFLFNAVHFISFTYPFIQSQSLL